MRAYLVRWPDDLMSLVLADDERQLAWAVGGTGDPATCTFEEYQGGPLCLSFKPTRSAAADKPVLEVPERPESQEECLVDLRRLFTSRLFSDISLEVEGGTIPAHKAVLAGRCQYFHAMFTSTMQESQQRTVRIEGFSYDIMYAVISFLYTGVLDIPPPHSKDKAGNGRSSPDDLLTYNKDIKFPFVEQVLQAADFYGLNSLLQLCAAELVDMAVADASNVSMATRLFGVGRRLGIGSIQDRGAFLVAQQLSKQVLMDEDISEVYADLSADLIGHMREVWEGRLHQPAILVGKDRQLAEYLQSGGDGLCEEQTREMITAGACPVNVNALHCLCLYWDNAQHGANLNQVSRLIDLFIKEGCAINGRDAVGLTPLHIAAVRGAEPLVRKLITCGASPHVKCRCHGHTPIEKVRSVFDEQMAQMMLVTGDTSAALGVGMDKHREVKTICAILTEAEAVDVSQSPCVVDVPSERASTSTAINNQHNERAQSSSSRPVTARLSQSSATINQTPPTSNQTPPTSTQAPPTSSKAPPQKAKAPPSPRGEINEYFVDALFRHGELSEGARVEWQYKGMGVTRWEFEDTVLEFMYPRFGQQLRVLCQKGETTGAAVETTEARKVLKSCLERDIKDAHVTKGTGHKLLSLQRIKECGLFIGAPQESWIHAYQS